MSSPTRDKRRSRLTVECLEGRALLATFGVPWHDPSHLTLSFAPDGSAIAGHTSSLFQSLNAQAASKVWKREVLRAFQTWAVQANVNIGLVADGGQAFGTPGKPQHDPRFGDIRIGAQKMSPEVLSVSIPNDPAVSSTWTGDVLINSDDAFGGKKLDLFSVVLHEAGHVFGLGENADPKSIMYGRYKGGQQLSPADIAALQALYGTRALDPNEGSRGNDTMGTATQVQFPGSYTGATPLVVYGDINSTKDADVFAVRPPSNYTGPVTFRLQSAGISLLTTHLTLLDARGNVLDDTQAASDFGDTVSLHLNRVSPNQTYYLKVQGATHDVFGIGSYGLGITFDAKNTATPAALDSVMRGPYQALSNNDIASIFQNPAVALFNHSERDGDLIAATQLSTTPGFFQNSHYETVASLSSPTDVHFYRIQRPNVRNGQGLVLTATVRAVDPNGVAPRVAIVDGNGNALDMTILANGNGTFTIQASNFKGGGNIYLRVTPGGAGSGVGNYALDAQFGTTPAQLTTFAGGNLDAGVGQKFYNVYIAESQIFQFLLSTAGTGVPAGTSVQMTITDKTGRVVGTLNAAVGDTVSGDALFLTPGAYILRFAVSGTGSNLVAPLSYSLVGGSISDPIGPALEDPTLAPVYTSPTMPGLFVYPGPVVTPFSYLIAPLLNQPPPPTLPPAVRPPALP